MHRNNQRIPTRVQCCSIVQLLKKAGFLNLAAGSVRLFCPASFCLYGSVAWGFFIVRKEVA